MSVSIIFGICQLLCIPSFLKVKNELKILEFKMLFTNYDGGRYMIHHNRGANGSHAKGYKFECQ